MNSTVSVNRPLDNDFDLEGQTDKFSLKSRNEIQRIMCICLEFFTHIRSANRMVPTLRFISKPQHLPFFLTA